MELEKYLKEKSKIVNRELSKYVRGKGVIETAMMYSLMAGGKRLRPVLAICAAEICGAQLKDILPAACALEYIHTYSLIHDDLPAMDNDDLRRGKPTSHKQFGEATAILAGDALLTEAFGLLAETSKSKSVDPKNIIEAVKILSKESGKNGMIEGQVKDTLESNRWDKKDIKSAKNKLTDIHLKKTAALIRASLKIGAVLAGADKRTIAKLDEYGKCIGLAFQVADDILDIEGNKKLLGKKGSDKDNNKLTYPAVYGLEESKNIERQLINKAKKEISSFGNKANVLSELADYIIERKY
jgi:geranylgeranyl diphosphate synthase type II